MENVQQEIRRVARGIRERVLQHTVDNNGGYLSQACSSAEILAALYCKIMHLSKLKQPLLPPDFTGVPSLQNQEYVTGAAFNGKRGPTYDRFILSPAHYALVLYTALVEVGRLAPEALLDFNRDGSTVEMIGAEHSPGMEVMTGSLGQGLSQASGIAMARKLKGESGNVWVFMSDGEFQSGQNWEAIQAAAFHKLSNLRIIVDVNSQQCDGPVNSVMRIDPFDDRLKAFGAQVVKISGHDIDALITAGAINPVNQPLVILAYTDPCAGITVLQSRKPKLHYVRFTSEDERDLFAHATVYI